MISPFQVIKVFGVALTLFAPASSTPHHRALGFMTTLLQLGVYIFLKEIMNFSSVSQEKPLDINILNYSL